jgi:hypothetical protein
MMVGMIWRKSLKLAVPVWLLVCAGIAAINYAADAQVPVGNLLMGFAAAYLVTAFIIKETAEDIAKWRATFGSKTDER